MEITSVRPSARPPVRPSARSSVRPPVRPSARPPTRPSCRVFVRPSVRSIGRGWDVSRCVINPQVYGWAELMDEELAADGDSNRRLSEWHSQIDDQVRHLAFSRHEGLQRMLLETDGLASARHALEDSGTDRMLCSGARILVSKDTLNHVESVLCRARRMRKVTRRDLWP